MRLLPPLGIKVLTGILQPLPMPPSPPTLTSGYGHGQRKKNLCPTLELTGYHLQLGHYLYSLGFCNFVLVARPSSAESWVSPIQRPVLPGFIRLWAHQKSRCTPGSPALHWAQHMHGTKQGLKSWRMKTWMSFPACRKPWSWLFMASLLQCARRGIWQSAKLFLRHSH